ncbi:MAG: hypothetical protein AB7V43_14400 [Acidimicrobiia bacterium]
MKVLILFLLVNFVIGLMSTSRTGAVRRLPLLGLCFVTTVLFSRYRWV